MENGNYQNVKKSEDYLYQGFINPMLNDTKAIANSYIYWRKNKDKSGSIQFSLDKFPFFGNYAFIAGIDEIINLIENFKFKKDDVEFLKSSGLYSYIENEFWDYLINLNLDDIILYGLDNGSLIEKSDEPILVLTGPLAKLKLLSFPISNLLSFSSLVCTNSVRMKIASGLDKKILLLEFGLRRAQGPLGGITASKYSYLVFDAVSNVLSGSLYNIPVKGTCAHAYIMSFQNEYYKTINANTFYNESVQLFNKCLEVRERLKWTHTNLDELFSFATFASVYKDSSNMLVDTYNTIESGVKNTIITAIALKETSGYKIRGIRLDSGDLPELSKKARELFHKIAEETGYEEIRNIKITASNDINENSINEFNRKGHAMDVYGIGTNLVTCQLQPFMEIKVSSCGHDLKPGKVLYENKISYNEKELEKSKKFLEQNLETLISHGNY
jgi:nicotinate phosphoribosyltransferase